MKSIAEFEAEQNRKRAQLEAEHAIAAALPVIPDSVQANHTRPAWAVYRQRTLTQALDVIAAFQIVPLWRYRGTFLELVPAGAEKPESIEESGPYAFALDVCSGESFGPTASLFFYSELPSGESVRIVINIEGPGYIGGFEALRSSRQPVAWDRRGAVTEWRVGPNAKMNGYSDSYVQWASGKKDARHTYLFSADTEDSAMGGDMTHACGQLVNMRDELQPEAELIETTAAASYWQLANGSYVTAAPGARAPAWGHGYTLEFCKQVTEKESAQ